MRQERKPNGGAADGSLDIQNSKMIQTGFMQNRQAEAEIDLLDLAFSLLDRIHYIILCFLAGAVLFNAYSYFFIAPTYQSTSKLYVVSSSDDSVVDLSDLNMGTSLTADYEELILSYPVLNIVIDRLDLEMTSEKLAKMITLVNPGNTRILRITVTSTDPYLARDIANTVAEVSVEYLPETMGTIAPTIAQTARLATNKSGPSYLKYTMMGAMLGMVLCCGFFIVLYLLDDTIRTPEDMEKYFGMVPLTSIPDTPLFEDHHTERKKKKGRRKA